MDNSVIDIDKLFTSYPLRFGITILEPLKFSAYYFFVVMEVGGDFSRQLISDS